ncbi:MAG: HAMP domain-containing sensor histidine kinase [Elusimicrobiota bacterium]
MTIRNRLAISFVTMILLVGVVGISLIASSIKGKFYFRQSLQDLTVTNLVKELTGSIDKQLKTLDYYLLLGEAGEKKKFLDYEKAVEEKFGELKNINSDENAAQLEIHYKQIVLLAQELIAVYEQGDRVKALKKANSEYNRMSQEMRDSLKSLLEKQLTQTVFSQARAERVAQTGIFISVFVLVVSIILGVILSLRIFRSIIFPLYSLQEGARNIGSGLLGYRMEHVSSDEFGELAKSFNEMATNLKKLQLQIITMNRMSAVGQLAGGVAHEINNPLTGVLGQAQILKEKMSENPVVLEHIEKIERAALRCRKIVRGLLDFSRQEDYHFEEADIVELIEASVALTSSDLERAKIEVIWDFPKDLPLLKVSPSHLQQVFLNLVTNALQAMPKGGKLDIIVQKVSAPAVVDKERKSKQSGYAQISFSDTGMGIKSDHLARIFEPFFTTKEIGKGTGLGLTISFGIIKNHNGTIDVSSPGEGKGTTFTIKLPLAG